MKEGDIPTELSRVSNSDTVELYLASIAEEKELGKRIDVLTRQLLEKPYQENPLIGSYTEEEEFVSTLDYFDCVTFCETVLALALSHTQEDFAEHLKKLRYKSGVPSWSDRNHYMSDWVNRNQDKGYILPILPEEGVVTLKRKLRTIRHYQKKMVEIEFVPKQFIQNLISIIQDGDILFFGTMREDLDVSHIGFFFQERVPMLRHASKGLKKVVNEPLDQFLKRFGATPGMFCVRPIQV